MNPGESYIILNEKAIDTTDIKPMNFTIKAITKKTEIQPINDVASIPQTDLVGKDKVDNSNSQKITAGSVQSVDGYSLISLGLMVIATLGISIIIINKIWKG